MSDSTLPLKMGNNLFHSALKWLSSGHRKLLLALLIGLPLFAYLLIHPGRNTEDGVLLAPAQRGDILDARGTPLTRQESRWQLYLNINNIRRLREGEAKKFAYALAIDLGLPYETVEERLSQWQGLARIKNLLLNDQAAQRLRGWLADSPWAKYGNLVQLDSQPWTANTEGTSMSHVIGVVNAEGRGRDGLQGSMDPLLKQGATLQLSLDSKAQRMIEQKLKEFAYALKAEDAMAAVIRLSDFRPIALASYPSNDPTYRPGFKSAWQRLRPVTDVFQLGPMVQPYLLAGAYGYKVPTLPKLAYDFSTANMSSGSKLVNALGLDKAILSLKQFSLDRKTGIEMPTEAHTLCCGLGDEATRTIELGHGQAVATSLVRYASSFAGLVKGGQQRELKLVTQVTHPDHRVENPTALNYGAEVAPKLAEKIRYVLIDRVRSATRDPDHKAGGMWATYLEKHDSGKVNRIVSAAFFTPAYRPKYVVALKLGLGNQLADENAGLKLGLEIIDDLDSIQTVPKMSD